MAVNNRKRALNLHYGEAETINSLNYALDNEFSKVIVEYDLASKDLNSAFVIISTPELLDKLATWGKKCVMIDSTYKKAKRAVFGGSILLEPKRGHGNNQTPVCQGISGRT